MGDHDFRRYGLTMHGFPLAWLGLTQWHLAVFAVCLAVGIALGAASTSSIDLSAAAFSVVEDPLAGETVK